MSHAGDQELILLAYGERTRISRHVESCLRCRSRAAKMREFLTSLEETPVPERDEAYGREVWRRLAPRLAQEPVPLVARLLAPRILVRVAAVMVLAAAAFLIGRRWPQEPAPLSVSARERVLLAAVGDHLESSQAVLLDFVNGDPAAEIPQRSRDRARSLLADNRLFRQTAASAGDAAVASVLDDLERVLIEVAHDAETPQSRAQLQRRIDSEEVLFKVRVLDSRVRAREEALPAAGRRL